MKARSAAVIVVTTLAVVAPGGETVPPRVAKGPHATVELIGSRPSGGELWVGLRFQLEPDWHVYWRNPGDSGGPPRVQWTRLPKGWSAGDIEWPAPRRIPLGRLVNYGYTGDVVLPIRINAPPGRPQRATTAGENALVADVRWLVCHDICVPGKATIGLSLDDLASASAGGWSALVGRARDRVPHAAPKAWRVRARADGGAFNLSISMDRPAERGTFFPIEESQIDDSGPQQVSVSGRELRFRLIKSDQLTTTPKSLQGVVTFPSGSAFEISAPVDGMESSGSR